MPNFVALTPAEWTALADTLAIVIQLKKQALQLLAQKAPPMLPSCALCGNDEAWHAKNDAKHCFVAPDSPDQRLRSSAPPPAPPPAGPSPLPISILPASRDVALRLALIEAGILPVELLAEAEAKLQAISGGGIVHAALKLARKASDRKASDRRHHETNGDRL